MLKFLAIKYAEDCKAFLFLKCPLCTQRVSLCFKLLITRFSSLSIFQYWMLSKTGEIRRDEACLDYAGSDVILYPCHGSKGNQFWTYDHEVCCLAFFTKALSASIFSERDLETWEQPEMLGYLSQQRSTFDGKLQPRGSKATLEIQLLQSVQCKR